MRAPAPGPGGAAPRSHLVRTALSRLIRPGTPAPPVLSGAARAGRLAAQARALGLSARIVDLAGAGGKAALMDAFARDLALPSWFGRNWDALYDALYDAFPRAPGDALPAAPPGRRAGLLVVDHARDLARADPVAWAAAEDVLRDVAATGRAVVVVRGTGSTGWVRGGHD